MKKQKTPKRKQKTTPAKVKASSAKLKPTLKKEKATRKKVKPTPAKLKALSGGQRVHIGYTLGHLLVKLEVTPAKLAAGLGVSAWSVRQMLKKKYLHARLLVRISKVLQHDVIQYLYLPEHLPGNPALEKRVDELEDENAALKKKVEMLEELNALLKKV